MYGLLSRWDRGGAGGRLTKMGGKPVLFLQRPSNFKAREINSSRLLEASLEANLSLTDPLRLKPPWRDSLFQPESAYVSLNSSEHTASLQERIEKRRSAPDQVVEHFFK